MESSNENKPKQIKDHKVVIDNRKKITITAITKVISANETTVITQLQNTKATITGKDLHINKLDIEQGVLEVVGEINLLKYAGSSEPKNFFKRIFQ